VTEGLFNVREGVRRTAVPSSGRCPVYAPARPICRTACSGGPAPGRSLSAEWAMGRT